MTVTRTEERAEFLADVLVCAVEGGIDYWAETSEYGWRFADLGEYRSDRLPEAEGPSAVVTIQDREHYELPAPTVVTIDTIAKGIGVLDRGAERVQEVRFVSEPTRKRLLAASRVNDAGQIDAGDADVIVQLGVFGEVIYG